MAGFIAIVSEEGGKAQGKKDATSGKIFCQHYGLIVTSIQPVERNAAFGQGRKVWVLLSH